MRQKVYQIFLAIFFILIIILGKNIFPFLIIIIILFVINIINKKKFMNRENVINMNSNFNLARFRKGSIIILIILFLIIFGFFSIVIIPAGETGVYHLFGNVYDKEMSSGLHFKNPLALVTKMSIRTEEYTMSATKSEGYIKSADAIKALTKEGLEVDLDITVLYHLEEEKASDVFKNVGLDYVEKIIRPSIRSGIREVVANYEAKDIYSEKRQEATGEILAKLKEDINQRGIIIEEVLLRNVNLPAKLSNAIQEKLTAEQEAQKYDFILQKEKKEAERKRIEAAGQRDAQKIINESLTTKYLNYLYIKNLKDRKGTIYIPINPSTGMPVFKGL
ncbi:MAG: prohibitin family protein [Xanthomonadaceae bacterium]|nr:prohibitin family protein [Rhodospirillaceae bacterium]NIA17657.1 prohibitin family protein [Xanthomonadaceae bacterium]